MHDAPTPISKKIVGILFFMTFADGLSLNFYNTIGALMMSYQFGIESEDVGYYVGYLASAYYVGQLLCNFPLSFISDRIGRKPVILFGLTLNIICQLAFGLSKWFWFAVLVRFINGLTNAGLPLTKCFVREVSDISNQARMFSFRSIGLAIGALVAPLIGSAFSRPADSNLADVAPLLGADFLVTFPYFLVCAIVCVVDTVCLIVLFFFLPETLPSKSQLKKKENLPLEIEMDEMEDIEDNGSTIEDKEEIIDDIVIEIDENSSKYSDEEPLIEENEIQIELDENIMQEEPSNIFKQKISKFLESSKRQLSYVDRGVLVSIGLYVILSFIVNITAQIIPIWATRDVSEDGLSFEEKQLGIMYSMGSISALLFQVFLFSRLDKKLGSNNSFRAAIIFFMPVTFLIPCLSFIADYRKLLWVLLFVLYGSFVIQLSWAFGAINVLMSNSAKTEIVGSVNGISTTLSALAKLIAPVLGDTIFAWSANLAFIYPFNYMFTFHIAVAVAIFCLFITIFLPDKLNNSRNE